MDLETWTNLLRYLSKDKKIYLWGTGSFSQDLTSYLELNGFSIEGYLDNDTIKESFNNKPVQLYSSLQNQENREGIFIVIASSFYTEIGDQCKRLGLMEFLDFLCPLKPHFYKSKASLIQEHLCLPNKNSYLDLVKAYIACHCIKEGDTIIDVGAHLGVFAKYYGLLSGKTGTVICFEANPVVFERLNENFKKNGNIITQHFAVSHSSDRNIEIKYYPDDLNQSCSTVEPLLMSEKRMPGKTLIAKVPTKKLDDLLSNNEIESCDFVKIDVEGHESAVIEGASKLLKKFKPIVIFEYGYNPSEFKPKSIELIENQDYLVFDCRNLERVRPRYIALEPTDLVAIPKTRMNELRHFIDLTPGISGLRL